MSGNLAVSTINGVDISASPVATESKVIGVNQTWQDVTGSRVAGTTYTNSTGKPIFVSIEADGAANVVYLQVDNIKVSQSYTSTYAWASVSAIVPNGSTYTLTSPVVVKVWSELR